MMELLLALGAIIISFTLVILTVPPILRIARAKNLFENFEERKIHTNLIPPLGGVAIFIGFILSTIIATNDLSFEILKYIIAVVFMIFFVGLKDDLLNISVRNKLSVQVFAALILIVLGNTRFTNLQGILGIYEINYFMSVIITLFAIVTIMNAFNLIDGIDGLASGLGMLGAAVLGIWFYLAGHYQFSIMSLALGGSLFGFFLYNVFGRSNKLFMGDSGSLIIGIVISILIIKFNEFNIIKTSPVSIAAAPMVSFAIIIVPLIDTIRVMTIRILNKKSPFSADNNHIHHSLLKLYNNHLKVTVTLVVTNVLIIWLAVSLSTISLNINFKFLTIFMVGIGLTFIPSLLLKIKTSSKRNLDQHFEKVQQRGPRLVKRKYLINTVGEEIIVSEKLNQFSHKVRNLNPIENKEKQLFQRKVVRVK